MAHVEYMLYMCVNISVVLVPSRDTTQGQDIYM